MPAIDSGKVLVTDANDFIAMWLVKALLERGFSVRGTVRSEAQGAHLKQTFASYGRRLEYVIVQDIAQVSATWHRRQGPANLTQCARLYRMERSMRP